MFDQTPINRIEGIKGYQPVSMDDSGGVRRLLSDITELVELQGKLVASDVKCLAEAATRPLILGAVSLVLMLGALPVLLLAFANFLVERFDWSLPVAQISAAGVAVFAAIILCAIAAKRLMACGTPLSRSMAELEKNMDTVREMLGGKSALGKHLEQMDRRERTN